METPSIDEMEIFELLNPETRGKRWGDWRLILIAERSGLLRRLERHCRRAEIRAVCQEPSWNENMELRFDLAINSENFS